MMSRNCNSSLCTFLAPRLPRSDRRFHRVGLPVPRKSVFTLPFSLPSSASSPSPPPQRAWSSKHPVPEIKVEDAFSPLAFSSGIDFFVFKISSRFSLFLASSWVSEDTLLRKSVRFGGFERTIFSFVSFMGSEPFQFSLALFERQTKRESLI